MTYSEKLRDPRWQKKRLEILNRDNFTCQDCYDTKSTLHVHHLDYESGTEPWGYPDDWYITLCETCHSEIEKKRKAFEENLSKRFRLHLKDEFSIYCVEKVLTEYDLNKLFSLLANINPKTVMWFLEKESNKAFMKLQNECFANDKPLVGGCIACGSDMRYHEKLRGAKCTVCNWTIPFSDKKIQELHGKQVS